MKAWASLNSTRDKNNRDNTVYTSITCTANTAIMYFKIQYFNIQRDLKE